MQRTTEQPNVSRTSPSPVKSPRRSNRQKAPLKEKSQWWNILSGSYSIFPSVRSSTKVSSVSPVWILLRQHSHNIHAFHGHRRRIHEKHNRQPISKGNTKWCIITYIFTCRRYMICFIIFSGTQYQPTNILHKEFWRTSREQGRTNKEQEEQGKCSEEAPFQSCQIHFNLAKFILWSILASTQLVYRKILQA